MLIEKINNKKGPGGPFYDSKFKLETACVKEVPSVLL